MKDEDSSKKKARRGIWNTLSLTFLKHWPLTLLAWLAVLAFGIYTYTNLIAREGFPGIDTPIVIVTANNFSDHAADNDEQVAAPLNKIIGEIDNVVYVQTDSTANRTTTIVSFKDGAASIESAASIRAAATARVADLPAGLELNVSPLEASRFLGEYDILTVVYNKTGGEDLHQLRSSSEIVAEALKGEPEIEDARIIPLLIKDEQSGEERQIGFNRVGLNIDGELKFYPAMHVGATKFSDEIDTLEFTKLVEQKLSEINSSQLDAEFEAVVIADFATAINDSIDRLEGNLLTGLIIISITVLLLISWRASIVMVLFILSVLFLSVLMLYLLGYSLNVITLFALILSLGLIVDDAVIMIEALDVFKKKNLPVKETVKAALDKILLASLSGTLTTVLVFGPLILVQGVFGAIIRPIPLTLMITLLTSFTLSIILIPTLAKFSILKDKRSTSTARLNPLPQLEHRFGARVAALPLLLKRRPRAGVTLMMLILGLSLTFLVASFSLFSRLSNDIFPPPRDADQIAYNAEFPAGYSLEQANEAAKQIDTIVTETIGEITNTANYTVVGTANQRQMTVRLRLKPLNEREEMSPVIIERLQQAFDASLDEQINTFVYQFDSGPPGIQYPFSLPINAEDEAKALELAGELTAYINSTQAPTLRQPSGEKIVFKATRIQPDSSQVSRLDNQRVINFEIQYGQVSANDTLLNETEEVIKERFNEQWLTANGYDKDILSVEVPETSFEESFRSLQYLFPVALVMIFLLLWWQFKSWYQPVLILLALPFAIAGVITWLYLTSTPFSFLVIVGLIALVGIAVNNTILLVSYANVARRAGAPPVEAISQAVKDRFRPLLITTLTTTLALVPIALNDFFWEPLALTIIWGLLSSTLLVLLTFPYYYIGINKLLEKFSKKQSGDGR